jgi:excisionase family DNA binding protein
MVDNKIPPPIVPDENWSPSGKLLLTIKETREILRVSQWTVYRLINARKLATIKIGSRRLVPIEAIQDLIERLKEESQYS